MPLFRAGEGEGAHHHTGGGRRTAGAVDCPGVAVSGALGLLDLRRGGSLLAPLGAPGGAGNGMEDHENSGLSREISKSPRKKVSDVKKTHPLQFLWNEVAPSALPKWMSTNPTRKRRADALMLEHGFPNLKAAIERIANSDFLMGRNTFGGRPWRASPEWFLRPGNVTRILEGEFDSLNPGSQRSAVSGFGPSHPLHPDNIAKRRQS